MYNVTLVLLNLPVEQLHPRSLGRKDHCWTARFPREIREVIIEGVFFEREYHDPSPPKRLVNGPRAFLVFVTRPTYGVTLYAHCWKCIHG
nr:hypothetical protein [uncultured organism]